MRAAACALISLLSINAQAAVESTVDAAVLPGNLLFSDGGMSVDYLYGAVVLSINAAGTEATVQLANGNQDTVTLSGSGGGLTEAETQALVGAMFTGNAETGITLTYDSTTQKIDAVATGGGGGTADGVVSDGSFADQTLTLERSIGSDVEIPIPNEIIEPDTSTGLLPDCTLDDIGKLGRDGQNLRIATRYIIDPAVALAVTYATYTATGFEGVVHTLPSVSNANRTAFLTTTRTWYRSQVFLGIGSWNHWNGPSDWLGTFNDETAADHHVTAVGDRTWWPGQTTIRQVSAYTGAVPTDYGCHWLPEQERTELLNRQQRALATTDPSTIEPDASAAEGTGTTAARDDHVHAIATASATGLATTSSEGSSTDFARADHRHGSIATVQPDEITPGQSGHVGTQLLVSRSDHAHSAPVGTPIAVGTSNLEGVAGSFARSDHRHQGAAADGVVNAGSISGTTITLDRTVGSDVTITGLPTGISLSDDNPDILQPDQMATEGTGTEASRVDHAHGILTGEPVDVGTSNAEGTSTSFSRADHVHDAGPHSNSDLVTAYLEMQQSQGSNSEYNTGAGYWILYPRHSGQVIAAYMRFFLPTSTLSENFYLNAAISEGWNITFMNVSADPATFAAPGNPNLSVEGRIRIIFDDTRDFLVLGESADRSDIWVESGQGLRIVVIEKTNTHHTLSVEHFNINDFGGRYRGAYSADVTYFIGDETRHSNNFWKSSTNYHDGNEPSSSSSHWVQIDSSGGGGGSGASLSDDDADTITPDQSGGSGSAATASRADHAHGIAAAAPDSLGTSASEGNSTSFARANHVHPGLSTSIFPASLQPDEAQHIGSSTRASRANHSHAIAAGTPVDIGTANAEGTGTTFARNDHVHDGGTSASLTDDAPESIVPDQAGAVGTGSTASRSDHDHAIAAAAPVALGTAFAEGTSTSFARADHVHNALAVSAPDTLTPDQVGEVGSSGIAARSNHRHAIAAGAASTIGTTNSEGNSTSFARANHIHQGDGVVTAGSVSGTTLTLDRNIGTDVTITGLPSGGGGNGASLSDADPDSITPDQAADSGDDATASRSDHVHGISTFTATTLASASSEGTSAHFARSDHRHGALATAAPDEITPGQSGSVGSGSLVARANHAHSTPAGTPSSVSTANHQGNAASFARSDHLHQGDGISDTLTLSESGGDLTVTIGRTVGSEPLEQTVTLPSGGGGGGGSGTFTRTQIGSGSQSSGILVATSITLTDALEDGEMVEFAVALSSNDRIIGEGLILADAILDLTAQTATPSSPDSDGAEDSITIKTGIEGSGDITSFGHGTLYVWLGADSSSLYLYSARKDAIDFVVYEIEAAGGGGGSNDGVVSGGSVSGTTLTLTRTESLTDVTITGLPSGGGASLSDDVPDSLTADQAGSAGTGTDASRDDHAHGIAAAAPSSVGSTIAEGTGTSFARHDHVHDVADGVVHGDSLVTGTIPTAKYGDTSVTSAKIAADLTRDSELPTGIDLTESSGDLTVTVTMPGRTDLTDSVTLPAGGGAATSTPARVESVEFTAASNIEDSGTVLTLATSPITVELGTGAAEMLSGTAGATTFTVEEAGVYAIEWRAAITDDDDRSTPCVYVRRNSDSAILGATTPPYFRYNISQDLITTGHLRVPTDDLVVDILAKNCLEFNSSDPFDVAAGSKFHLMRASGLKGDTGPEGPAGSGGSNDGVVNGGSVSGTTLTLTRTESLTDVTITGLPSGGNGSTLSDDTPDSLQPDQSGAAGTATTASRADHAHAINSSTPVSTGTSNQEGNFTSFARTNHVHAIGFTGNSPDLITPDQAGGAGTAANPARLDHSHSIIAAIPVSVGTDLNEGTGVSFARSNHRHDLGDDSVVTDAIADDAVTGAKVADNTIHGGSLVDNTIPTGKYGDATVTDAKIHADIARDNELPTGIDLSESSGDLTVTVTMPGRTDLTDSVTLPTGGGMGSTLSDDTPEALTPDVAGDSGSASTGSRVDHVHGVAAGVPVNVGTGNAEGDGTTFARNNHVHGVTYNANIRSLSPDNSATAGTNASPSRSDHRHGISAGAPVAVGSDNAEGSATTFSRADHVHDGITLSDTAPTTIQTVQSGISGTAVTAARRDHRHGVSSGNPVNIGTANAGGTSNTFARSNHVHNHNLRGISSNSNTAPSSGDRFFVTDESDTGDPLEYMTYGQLSGFVRIYRGAWQSSQAYPAGRIVLHDGDLWMSDAQIFITEEPGADANWRNISEDQLDLSTANPVLITPDTTSIPGTSTFVTRADHRHGITAAAPVTVGTANAEGTATNFSRSDHVHDGSHLVDTLDLDDDTPTGIAPDQTGTSGTDSHASRGDHRHAAPAGMPTSHRHRKQRGKFHQLRPRQPRPQRHHHLGGHRALRRITPPPSVRTTAPPVPTMSTASPRPAP